jgi:hypothetical protein
MAPAAHARKPYSTPTISTRSSAAIIISDAAVKGEWQQQ